MVQLQAITSSSTVTATAATRRKRQYGAEEIHPDQAQNSPTSGSCCTCQVGPPGPPGPPGRDGRPGLDLFAIIKNIDQFSITYKNFSDDCFFQKVLLILMLFLSYPVSELWNRNDY